MERDNRWRAVLDWLVASLAPKVVTGAAGFAVVGILGFHFRLVDVDRRLDLAAERNNSRDLRYVEIGKRFERLEGVVDNFTNYGPRFSWTDFTEELDKYHERTVVPIQSKIHQHEQRLDSIEFNGGRQ